MDSSHVRGLIAQNDASVPEDEDSEETDENHVGDDSFDYSHGSLQQHISGEVEK